MTSLCPRSSCVCSGRRCGSKIHWGVAARSRGAPGVVGRGTAERGRALAVVVGSPPTGEVRRPLREVGRRRLPPGRDARPSCRGRHRRKASGAGRALRCRRALRAILGENLEGPFAHSPRARARRPSARFALAPRADDLPRRAMRMRASLAPDGPERPRGLERAKAEPLPQRQGTPPGKG